MLPVSWTEGKKSKSVLLLLLEILVSTVYHPLSDDEDSAWDCPVIPLSAVKQLAYKTGIISSHS